MTKRQLHLLGRVFRLLFVLWFLPHLVLWSGAGQEWTSTWLSERLSNDKVTVQIGRVSGILPFYVRAYDVSVETEDISVRSPMVKTWTSPLLLFTGALHLDSATLYNVQVDGDALEEPPPPLQISGDATLRWPSLRWNADLRLKKARSKEPETEVHLQGFDLSNIVVDVNEPANGYLSQLAKQPKHPPLQLRADLRPSRDANALLALFRLELLDVEELGGTVTLCGEAAWKPSGDTFIRRIHAESAIGEIEGHGVLTSDLAIQDGKLNVTLHRSTLLEKLSLPDAVHAQLKLSGPLSRPRIRGAAQTAQIGLGMRQVQDVHMELDSTLDGARGVLLASMRASHWEAAASGDLRLRWSPDKLAVEQLQLSIGRQRVDMSGGFAFADENYWFEGELGGSGSPYWNLHLAGGGALGMRPSLTLQRLSGELGAVDFYLPHAATWTVTPYGVELDSLDIQVGKKGHIAAQMRATPDLSEAVLTLEKVPADIASIFQPTVRLDGSISGEAAVRDEGLGVTGSMRWEVAGLRFLDSEYSESPSVTSRAELSITPEHWELLGKLDGPVNAAPSHIHLSLPIRLGLRPLRMELPETERLSGSMRASGRLAPFIQPFLVDTNRIRGSVEAELSLSGTWAVPQMNGRAQLSDGIYESLYTGTTFRDVNATLVASGSNVTLQRFTAKGGKKSSIEGEGSLLLDPAEAFPFTLHMDLENTELLKLDHVDGSASGTLKLQGDIHKATLSGRVEIDNLLIHIPNTIRKEAPTLDVIYVNGPASLSSHSKARPPRASDPYPLHLNVTLDAPKHIFLSGRGLTSEWGGAVDLRGTIENPLFYGYANVHRGEFLMGGGTSPLRSGVITMNGSLKKNTEISLEFDLDYGATDTLPISISGPLSGIEIVGLTELTQVDAVQIAQVAMQLTGGAVGPDILGALRHRTGLDLLDVGFKSQQTGEMGEDGERLLAIQVGKYLKKGVSISLAQTFAKEGAKTALDMSFTKNLKLRAELADAEESAQDDDRAFRLQLTWHKDY